LRHFKQRAANSVTVAYANLPVRQAVDGEVFPELSANEVVSTELALPIPIGVHLIDENRPMFPAMPSKVPLPIAIHVEPTHYPRASNRFFPNGRADGLPLPLDVSR
jgi:hypothetical protein